MIRDTQYDSGVGRPRKRPEDRNVTPLKSFRVRPPELWDEVMPLAKANGENVTDILNRALADYKKKHGKGKR